jgi:hypothetical protein
LYKTILCQRIRQYMQAGKTASGTTGALKLVA